MEIIVTISLPGFITIEFFLNQPIIISDACSRAYDSASKVSSSGDIVLSLVLSAKVHL